jgi:hypothetical protein
LGLFFCAKKKTFGCLMPTAFDASLFDAFGLFEVKGKR